jgi:hypothetical protein
MNNYTVNKLNELIRKIAARFGYNGSEIELNQQRADAASDQLLQDRALAGHKEREIGVVPAPWIRVTITPTRRDSIHNLEGVANRLCHVIVLKRLRDGEKEKCRLLSAQRLAVLDLSERRCE